MRFFEDKLKRDIRELRLFLIEQFNSCSENKIISDGSQAIDLLEHYNNDEVDNNPKMKLIIESILEFEGFEEASEELSEKEQIKELKELSKKIRKAIQEV